MSNVRFVTRPGGIIVHFEDGRAEARQYNSQLDIDEVVAHQREAAIAATSERPNSAHGDPQEIESARRAALADAEATALPSNYSDLDEEAAVVLMVNVTSVAKQAALLGLEVRTKGGRQRVMDAASGAARALFEMTQDEQQRQSDRLTEATENPQPAGPPAEDGPNGDGDAALADPDHPAGKSPQPPVEGDPAPGGRRRRTPPTS
jgi:hypothetical protein